jgi:hypothetical protein
VTTGSASGVDDQILAIWRALRTNPGLDARWAMQAIDRLLDQRLGQAPAPGPPAAVLRGPAPGSPVQQAIVSAIARAILSGEPG